MQTTLSDSSRLAHCRFLLVLAGLLIALSAPAREWTSSDGKTLEADYVSATADSVTLKISGKEVKLPLSRLSKADADWVEEQKRATPAPSLPGAKAKPQDGTYSALMTGEWALSKFRNLPFAMYAAKELDPSKTYPLILALHGKSDNNENGKQVGDWMRAFTKPDVYSKNPSIMVAPLCYQPYGGTGGGWSDKPGTEAVALVKDMLKLLPIDRKRVYIMGHSMGGFGTCQLIINEPRLFAAGIPMCGCSGDAGSLRKTPLWVFHAADDTVVKPDTARALAKALDRSRIFKYTEYPDGGHGIPGRVVADAEVIKWLFAQPAK
jgi:predicted esterase